MSFLCDILITDSYQCLRQQVPDDGLPVLEDWLTVWEGMIFAGADLVREPLDVSARILFMKIFLTTHMNDIMFKVCTQKHVGYIKVHVEKGWVLDFSPVIVDSDFVNVKHDLHSAALQAKPSHSSL